MLDEDECWFSRFAAPKVYQWTDGNDIRMTSYDTRERVNPAVSCYGVRCSISKQVVLGFFEGQPLSEMTWNFVQGLLARARQMEKKLLVLIWDNAGWHLSKRLKLWIHQHNQQAKATGDVRLLTHLLPRKSPWLNPIEPCWLHAKRAIWEPSRPLEVQELKERLCSYFALTPSSLPFQLCIPN